MNNRTVDEQLAILRNAVASPVLRQLHYWMVGTAVVLVIASAVLWNPVPLMIGAFIGLVGIGGRQTIPNILNALHAYESVPPATGTAAISITCWSDDNNYQVVLREAGQPDWGYEFIPQGWTPVEGTHAARIWRLSGHPAPALAAVDDGVLIPRYDPKRVQAEESNRHCHVDRTAR